MTVISSRWQCLEWHHISPTAHSKACMPLWCNNALARLPPSYSVISKRCLSAPRLNLDISFPAWGKSVFTRSTIGREKKVREGWKILGRKFLQFRAINIFSSLTWELLYTMKLSRISGAHTQTPVHERRAYCLLASGGSALWFCRGWRVLLFGINTYISLVITCLPNSIKNTYTSIQTWRYMLIQTPQTKL